MVPISVGIPTRDQLGAFAYLRLESFGVEPRDWMIQFRRVTNTIPGHWSILVDPREDSNARAAPTIVITSNPIKDLNATLEIWTALPPADWIPQDAVDAPTPSKSRVIAANQVVVFYGPIHAPSDQGIGVQPQAAFLVNEVHAKDVGLDTNWTIKITDELG